MFNKLKARISRALALRLFEHKLEQRGLKYTRYNHTVPYSKHKKHTTPLIHIHLGGDASVFYDTILAMVYDFRRGYWVLDFGYGADADHIVNEDHVLVHRVSLESFMDKIVNDLAFAVVMHEGGATDEDYT